VKNRSCISWQFSYAKNIKTNIEIPQKYILFIGSRRGYKNFDLFLESVAKIFKKTKNHASFIAQVEEVLMSMRKKCLKN